MTNLYASGSVTGETEVDWTNPADSDYADTIVTYAAGRVAPATPDDGTLLYDGNGHEVVGTLPRIARGYSFSAFAVDTSGNVSAAATYRLVADANITLHARPKLLLRGRRVTLYGRFTVAGTDIPMAHHPMRFRQRHLWQENWHVRIRFRTDADGRFRVRLRLKHTTLFILDDSFTNRADSGKGPIRVQVTRHL